MPTKSQADETTPAFAPLFSEMNAKALDAMTAFAQANQRVLQELVEFSTAAAKESVRTYAELQSAALESARDAHTLTVTEREDPVAWYQRSLLGTVDGTQRALKLFETNTQVLTRSAERLHANAQRAGKEIQEALTSYMSRMKDLSGRN
jgi:hypothetical protein